jgi:hypothetical protein
LMGTGTKPPPSDGRTSLALRLPWYLHKYRGRCADRKLR